MSQNLRQAAAQMPRTWVILALLVLLQACAPRLQSLSRETVTPALTDAGFVASDGRLHKVSSWVPSDSPTKAVIVGLHGFNDYRKAFESPASEFVKDGIAVLAFDQRGFGEDKQAGIWPGSDRMVSDAKEFSSLVRKLYPDVPVFLLGSSMGGAVTLLAAADADPPPVNGVILVAPAVWGWSQMNIFYRASLWVSAHLAPAAVVTGRGLKITPSDNIDMLRAMSRDPLVIKETRIDSVYGLVNLMQKALEAAPNVHLPVLLLYGKTDDVIPEKAIRQLRKDLGQDTEYEEFSGGYHMLLRDCRRSEVIARIVTFINSVERRDASAQSVEIATTFSSLGINLLTK